MSMNQGNSSVAGGWNSQPQQQHMSQGQGSSGAAQVDGDPQAAAVAALAAGNGGGQQQAPSGNGQGQGQQSPAQPQGQQNDFIKGLLEQIDPAHRPIVEPYLSKWNAGVNRRFQELHGELAPYKELGADPETITEALGLLELIDTNPQYVLQQLQEALAQANEGQPQGQPQGQPGTTPPPEGQPAQSAIPPELEERFGMFERVLEVLAEQTLSQRSAEQESSEDAELDQYLTGLQQEFGDFDEHYVLAKMMAGIDGAEAVKQYQTAIQGQVNDRARRPNVPPILGGGGAVPQEGKKVEDASRKETKSLVANILAASQQQ